MGLADFDLAQVELRIPAKDAALADDPYRVLAAHIFCVPIAAVTSEQREAAKLEALREMYSYQGLRR